MVCSMLCNTLCIMLHTLGRTRGTGGNSTQLEGAGPEYQSVPSLWQIFLGTNRRTVLRSRKQLGRLQFWLHKRDGRFSDSVVLEDRVLLMAQSFGPGSMGERGRTGKLQGEVVFTPFSNSLVSAIQISRGGATRTGSARQSNSRGLKDNPWWPEAVI